VTDGIAHDDEVLVGVERLAWVEKGTSELFHEKLGARTSGSMEENNGVVGSIGIDF
jgi:hypothetical protein